MQNPMSYEKAKAAFDKYNKQFIKDDGVVFRILITPSDNLDFKKYLDFVRAMPNQTENETALRFSSDGLFIIRQIHVDDSSVISKIIELNI